MNGTDPVEVDRSVSEKKRMKKTSRFCIVDAPLPPPTAAVVPGKSTKHLHRLQGIMGIKGAGQLLGDENSCSEHQLYRYYG